MQPYTSPPPIAMVVQSSTVASKALPELSDTIKSSRQASPSPVTSSTTRTPSPAGIVAPCRLNPNTVLLPVDTVKPAAAAAGFTVSTGNNTVLGFSLQGATIPAGDGVLVVLDVTGDGDACLEDLIVSDSSGNALDATVEDCTTIAIGGGDVYGCMDMDACNYNADATADDDSCTYAEENYDCDGNCIAGEDCAGECGGSAEVDECGVCDGDNSSCADCAGVPNGDSVIC